MSTIVVLASGRGSNFLAIHQAIQRGELNTEITAVISDQPNAGVLTQAKKVGIPPFAIPIPLQYERLSLLEKRQAHEELLLHQIKKLNPQFLVLAGYMKILTAHFIEKFRCDRGYTRLVNIHPSLLPAFPGIRAYAQAYRYGVKVTGATVHLVEAKIDSGPICAQEVFSIENCRSEEEVEQLGLTVEHRLYPRTLKWLLKEKFKFETRAGGRISVCPN